MRRIVLIVHNVRSTHNVGSILRTADGLGIKMVYLTGYTPYPATASDSRLPHIATRVTAQIHKTALGAEKTVQWQHRDDPIKLIEGLKKSGYLIGALEQTENSTPLPEFKSPGKVSLVVGSEITGLPKHILKLADANLEIPMMGSKESFNVSVATAIALYHLQFASR